MAGKDLTADNRGFSLVEILVTIAILGILVTIGATSFRELNEKYRIEAATKQFYADLMEGRGRAMQRNRVHYVQMTSNGYTIYDDTNKPVIFGKLSSTITFPSSGSPGGVMNFQFNRNGIASTAGYVRVQSSVPRVFPDYNCITIAETRIKMGQYNGAACVEK